MTTLTMPIWLGEVQDKLKKIILSTKACNADTL